MPVRHLPSFLSDFLCLFCLFCWVVIGTCGKRKSNLQNHLVAMME